jgi:hypothetical protein
MSSARAGFFGRGVKGRPIDEATEPRSYDRRFYAGVLLAAFVVIVLVVAFAVYRVAFNTVTPPSGPSFDLTSLSTGGKALPDPQNPCIILQEHLEAIRSNSYRNAYDYFCQGLKKITTLDAFSSNAKTNSLLFYDISAYHFTGYQVNGTAASATGYIIYKSGGRSKVDVQFAREGSSWKVALMTVIYL